MDVRNQIHEMKLAAPTMAASSIESRNRALALVAEALEAKRDAIFSANERDLAAAAEAGVAATVQKRLRFDEGKLADCIEGRRQLAALEDPVGRVLLARELDEGLVLRRVTCPIGVIGVIFEARPDALVQISSLCIKSGNCAVLKGGRETANTNRVLFETIRAAAVEAGLPESALLQAELHSEIDIVVDAKTQYPAVCNAAETLLVDRAVAAEFLPRVAAALAEKGARLRGTAEVVALLGGVEGIEAVEEMAADEFSTEYGDYVMSCAVVDGVREAVAHVNRYGSHHTDAIVTESDEAAEYFMQMVDSAGVYRNCSTRFADGFRYGFGAEVGISTGKLHARGPVGLEGLVTYKYRLVGDGHVVADYASGARSFHYREL